MNNQEKLYLAKVSAQISPSSPAISQGFDVNGTNYKLSKPATPELGSPQQMMAGITNPPQDVNGTNPGGFNNLGADGKPMMFEPSDGALAVTPEIMEMGRTGTYPQKNPAPAMAAGPKSPATALGGSAPLPQKPVTGTAAVNP